MAMLVPANRGSSGIGGHISTFASAATLYEVAFNHFLRGPEAPEGPAGGLPSYPHPRAMPDYWQFPTVSMGLAPIQAIYPARFMRYLEDTGMRDHKDQRVWAFLGDGEFDEPESMGASTARFGVTAR